MKAKNSEQIAKGYTRFAVGLIVSTALSITTLSGFIRTNVEEYRQMESKT